MLRNSFFLVAALAAGVFVVKLASIPFFVIMVALLLLVVLGACQKKSVMAPENTAPES